ncbi:MAG: ATP-binding protein [Symploca sp. SIO2E6]|nr:ATP-binding protein [Symploca sp. SIO2E6]
MERPTIPTRHYGNVQYLLKSVDRVRQALIHYLENRESLPAAPELASVASNLDKLCTTFYLSPFERDLLLLCVGMETDPNFESLCSQAQTNAKYNYPTFSLALTALPGANWNVLSAQNALQHWQLIEIVPGFTLTQSPLRIDKSILCYLLGEPFQDEELAGIVKPLSLEANSTLLPPSQQGLVDNIVATWSEPTTNRLPILQLSGSEIVAKRNIVATVCRRLGFALSTTSTTVLPADPKELHQLIRHWERQAMLTTSALLLECDQVQAVDARQEIIISQLLEQITTPLIISSQERKQTQQCSLITFDVPRLTYTEQQVLWETYLGTVTPEINGQIRTLVSQFNLNSRSIQAACSQLKSQLPLTSPSETEETIGKTEGREAQFSHQLWDFCRIQARPRLDDLAQRIESTATWEDLILPERERQILRNLATHVQQRHKVYQDWGFADKGSRGLGISALFAGPSGTGKTMASEILAKEFRLDLYRIDLSAVVSKYIGETEKNLGRIFNAAEAGGAVLLFDEADALFGKRTQVQDSHDRYANVEVSYLLQRMEAYQGLAILTTNMKKSLDQAFLRRIRFVLDFPFPDANARKEIWQRIFPNQTPTEGLDYKKLGKLSITGGNIRNIALNASFLAADAGEPVMMKHILQATRSEYLKMERPLTDTEIRGWV